MLHYNTSRKDKEGNRSDNSKRATPPCYMSTKWWPAQREKGEKDKNTALRWTADINDMSELKSRNDGNNNIGIQKREQSSYVLLFCVVGYSCICDAAWPCPPARPAPPVYGLKRCLAHIQYIDCKRQPMTHRGACLWCLHNRFRNSGRAHLKSLWTHTHTHTHTEPYWSVLLMDGSIIAPATGFQSLSCFISRALPGKWAGSTSEQVRVSMSGCLFSVRS